MSARFDWYQATVRTDVRPLLGALERVADGASGMHWEDLKKAPQGYGFGSRLNDADGALCMVWWGGCHEYPHVIGSGESAQAVAQVLRAEYRDTHAPSRVDPCIDFAEPGAFDRLQGLALNVAREHRVSVDTRGDHLLNREGRTIYLGAPTSTTRARIYEKGDELRAKFRNNPARLATVPDELARLECQVRPHTPQARLLAAHADPLTIMGSARWMRALMKQVADLDLEPFEAGRPWREADDTRAYNALLAQYGGLLRRICGDLGSWDMLGRQIGHDLDERDQQRR